MRHGLIWKNWFGGHLDLNWGEGASQMWKFENSSHFSKPILKAFNMTYNTAWFEKKMIWGSFRPKLGGGGTSQIWQFGNPSHFLSPLWRPLIWYVTWPNLKKNDLGVIETWIWGREGLNIDICSPPTNQNCIRDMNVNVWIHPEKNWRYGQAIGNNIQWNLSYATTAAAIKNGRIRQVVVHWRLVTY